ncbi:MAG: glutathione S-transferase family protein [Polyangiaceae bacterium]
MTQTIEIFGFAQSTFTRTACMAALEHGLSYELKPAKLGDASYAELHPFQKMPALRKGGRVVFETLAVVAELDALAQTKPLIPEEKEDRVSALCWSSALSDYVYPKLVGDWCIALMQDQLKGKQKDAMREEVRSQLTILERGLGGRGTFASRLSVADLLLAPMLAYVEQLSPELLEERGQLAKAYEALKSRESFKRTAG